MQQFVPDKNLKIAANDAELKVLRANSENEPASLNGFAFQEMKKTDGTLGLDELEAKVTTNLVQTSSADHRCFVLLQAASIRAQLPAPSTFGSWRLQPCEFEKVLSPNLPDC